MRLIDADELFDELKRNDLEFMQQNDLLECIKSIIDLMPTAYDIDSVISVKSGGVEQ